MGATKTKPEAPAADPTAAWRQALVRVADLKPSPTNPRTTFDPAELAELAENVRRYGVLQPLLVRPVPIPGHPAPRLDGPRWDGKLVGLELEVVAGERRRRAALAAGLAEVPAVVRMLTDEEVLAIQLTEIDQSVGIKVSERVRAYGRLADAGKNAEEIAATVDRPVKFVRGLLRMARLPAWALAAVDRGILPRATAEMVARVPGEESRKRAAGCVLLGVKDPRDLDREEWNDGDTWEEACEGIALGGPTFDVLSLRDTADLIRTHFNRELKTAPFSRKSLDLLPDAGSCDACPKRAGNDPEALAEGTRADTCLDPDCYRRKVEAYKAHSLKTAWEKHAVRPADLGVEGFRLPPRGWCDLARQLIQSPEIAAEEIALKANDDGRTATLEKLLKPTPPVKYMAFGEGGKAVTLAKTAEVRRLLQGLGVLKKPAAEKKEKRSGVATRELYGRTGDKAGADAGTTPAAKPGPAGPHGPSSHEVEARALVNAARILGEYGEEQFTELADVEDACANGPIVQALRLSVYSVAFDMLVRGSHGHVAVLGLRFPGITGEARSQLDEGRRLQEIVTWPAAQCLAFLLQLAAALEMPDGPNTEPARDLLDFAELDWDQQLDQARRELAGGETTDAKLVQAEAASTAEPKSPPKVTPLSQIDGIPDAVLDLLMGPDATGKLTLERVLTDCESATARIDLPLRNRLVTYFVKLGAKLKPAEYAAEAIAAAVREGEAAETPLLDAAAYNARIAELKATSDRWWADEKLQAEAAELWGGGCNGQGVFEEPERETVAKSGKAKAEVLLAGGPRGLWVSVGTVEGPGFGSSGLPQVWNTAFGSREAAREAAIRQALDSVARHGATVAVESSKGDFAKLVKALRSLLGEPAELTTKPATAPAKPKHVKIDGDVAAVLAGAEADGTKLHLPPKQLDLKLYDRVNKVLEQLGGAWSKKEKAHLFPEPVAPLLAAALADGKVLDQKQSYQFFPTPPALARRVIDAAGLEPGMRVLEPSAGLGAIADLVPAGCTLVVCELHENMARTLRMTGKTVVPGDFLEYVPSERFDRVVMNPPFTGLQDAAHVRHAFALTKPGGRVVAIVPESTMGRKAAKAEAFRDWLDDLGAEIDPVPAGTFKESGTDAGAYLVVIDKPAACRVCGCTDDDCSGCVEKTGRPCSWAEPDLCSACAGEKPAPKEEKAPAKKPAGKPKKVCPSCFGARVEDRGGGPCRRCGGAGDVAVPPPPKPKDPAAAYGWDVTYKTHRNETLTCHYIGTEKTARRKAMLRPLALEVVSATPLTEEQWVRAYGRGRM